MRNAPAIPARLNGWLSALTLSCTLFQLFVLPLWLLPLSPWWGVLLVILLPVNTTLWSLIHEAIHKLLHPQPRLNERMGRIMSIVMGASFHVLRFAHLMHHRFNRDWESEHYNPQQTSRLRASLRHYAYLFGGLYLMEVFSSLILSLLPRPLLRRLLRRQLRHPSFVQMAERYAFRNHHLVKIRTDTALIALLYSASALAYGAYWPLLCGLLLGRALLISIADNAYHYATPADNSQSAHELQAPGWLSALMLSFNHHRTHHLYPGTPWRSLKARHEHEAIAYDGAFAPALWRQFRGPVPQSRNVSSMYHGE